MEFTYKWYRDLVSLIRKNYTIKDWRDDHDGVIIRHDVDYDLKKAYEFAKYEKELGVKSTFLILLSSDFYNVFSLDGQMYIKGIIDCGHEIGLHFDEKKYEDNNTKSYIQEKIEWEAGVLSELIEKDVSVVSMHRPSKEMLEWDIDIPGIVNTYSREFFDDYKYVSDSRRRWREDVVKILEGGEYRNIQILIHPFWYDNFDQSIYEAVSRFVNSANMERYDHLAGNITDLSDIMKREEIRQ